MAKRAFTQKRQLLTNKTLNLKTRKNSAKSYVWSILAMQLCDPNRTRQKQN